MTYKEGYQKAVDNVDEVMLNMPLGPVMKAQIRVAIIDSFKAGAELATALGEEKVERVFAAWREANENAG